MKRLDTELDIFVEKERAQFENYDNNRFALAFGQLIRYYKFLALIKERYDCLSGEFHKNLVQHKALFSIKGAITKEQSALLEDGRRMGIAIQLEIESYYLFAKILLDKVARFLEHYFGSERGLSLDSHDQWTKNSDAYCKRKGLTGCLQIQSSLHTLKKDIADFRDYQIAHEKSPRTVQGLVFCDRSHGVAMMKTKTYPEDKDAQTQTKLLSELQADIDSYLREIMQLIGTNGDKTRLKRRDAI